MPAVAQEPKAHLGHIDQVDRIEPHVTESEEKRALMDDARRLAQVLLHEARRPQMRPCEEYLREAPSVIHQGALFFALGDVRLNPVDLVDVAKVGFRLLRDGGHEGARLSVTGPEALTMAQVADRVSRATGRPVHYVPVSRNDRQQALLSHGVPAEYVEALDKQVEERLQGGIESRVDLSTHRLFDVQPTTFLEFAERNAEAFGGRVREGALA